MMMINHLFFSIKKGVMIMKKMKRELILKKAPGMKPYKFIKTNLGGGEGTIYKMENSTDYIAKIFNSGKTAQKKAQKIDAVIELFKSINKNNTNFQDIFENKLAMPRARLYSQKNKKLRGFLMNNFNPDKYILLQKYIDRHGTEYKHKHSWLQRLNICMELIKSMRILHKLNFVLGDLNDQNFFIRKRDMKVVFIDCDSYQLEYKNKYYPLDAIKRDIIPPELRKNAMKGPLTEKSDRYALGVKIYKILMNGFSPYQFSSNNFNQSKNEIIKKNLTPLLDDRLKLPPRA